MYQWNVKFVCKISIPVHPAIDHRSLEIYSLKVVSSSVGSRLKGGREGGLNLSVILTRAPPPPGSDSFGECGKGALYDTSPFSAHLHLLSNRVRSAIG